MMMAGFFSELAWFRTSSVMDLAKSYEVLIASRQVLEPVIMRSLNILINRQIFQLKQNPLVTM